MKERTSHCPACYSPGNHYPGYHYSGHSGRDSDHTAAAKAMGTTPTRMFEWPMMLVPTTTRLRETAVAFLLAAVLATLATTLLDLPLAASLLALGVLVPFLAPVALRAPVLQLERGIGAANRITVARAIIVAGCAGLLPYPHLVVEHGWWVLLAAGVALALDGIDGAVARATNTATDFGARFDMELDAFFIMILCGLVWMTGQVDSWVLLIGLMRYAFVAAGLLLPALRRPLPPSLRRKAICVVQAGSLILCLAPPVGPAAATPIAAVALGLLTVSFALDIHWLLRHRFAHPDTGEPA